MEIKPFKMCVTPEQSRIVQQTLFNNEYRWAGEKGKNIDYLNKPYLYWENLLKHGSIKDNFIEDNLPELTFQEFFDTYVKWCIRGNIELGEWEEVNMKGKCDHFLYNDELFFALQSTNLLFWNSYDKIPKDYIEITFEQFKQYVLKTKEDKVMEKKIIGYKLKEEAFKHHDLKNSKEYVLKTIANIGLIYDNMNRVVEEEILDKVFKFPDVRRHFEAAGVLDLWFEPVYENTSKELYFGKVRFTIKKGDNFAITEYGKVTKEEIKNAINYIENPPKLNNYILGVRMEKGTTTYTLDIIEKSKEGYIAFGCQEGTYKELKEIYNAFE